ncbi:MAG: hypothetical protein K2X76_15070 [Sphingomonas sp.]|nr:hypothetical protein [Sphingomonas sp.]
MDLNPSSFDFAEPLRRPPPLALLLAATAARQAASATARRAAPVYRAARTGFGAPGAFNARAAAALTAWQDI